VYSLELFRGVLPAEHYAYWELFVEACRLTELPSLTGPEIILIRDAWHAHNDSFPALYEGHNFSPKHHELSHEDARVETGPSHVTHCFMVTSAHPNVAIFCVLFPLSLSLSSLSLTRSLSHFHIPFVHSPLSHSLSLSLSACLPHPPLSFSRSGLLSRVTAPIVLSHAYIQALLLVLTPVDPPIQMEMQNGIAASVNNNGRNPQLSIMRWVTQRHRLVNVILKLAATALDLVTSPPESPHVHTSCTRRCSIVDRGAKRMIGMRHGAHVEVCIIEQLLQLNRG
jgi:hypothetical protein